MVIRTIAAVTTSEDAMGGRRGDMADGNGSPKRRQWIMAVGWDCCDLAAVNSDDGDEASDDSASRQSSTEK